MRTKDIRCEHNLRQWHCRDCGGGGTCAHKNDKYDCRKCWPKNFCECGKKRMKCKIHRPPRKLCTHGRAIGICDTCIEIELRAKMGLPAGTNPPAQKRPAAQPKTIKKQRTADSVSQNVKEAGLPVQNRPDPQKKSTAPVTQISVAEPPEKPKKQRVVPDIQRARKSAPTARKIIIVSSEASDEWDVSYSTPSSSSEYLPEE